MIIYESHATPTSLAFCADNAIVQTKSFKHKFEPNRITCNSGFLLLRFTKLASTQSAHVISTKQLRIATFCHSVWCAFTAEQFRIICTMLDNSGDNSKVRATTMCTIRSLQTLYVRLCYIPMASF